MHKPFRYACFEWQWTTNPHGLRERVWEWKGRSWWPVWLTQVELREFGLNERNFTEKLGYPLTLLQWETAQERGIYARTDGWRKFSSFAYLWKYQRARTLFALKWRLQRHPPVQMAQGRLF